MCFFIFNIFFCNYIGFSNMFKVKIKPEKNRIDTPFFHITIR